MNRDKKGRFARTKKWIKRVGIVCFCVIMGGAIYGDHWVGKELSVAVPQPVYAGETMQAKVEAELDKVINQIAQAESQGSKTEDALITIDDNKAGSLPRKDKVSLGCMQYKISTVQRHWKAVHGEELTNYQAVMVALDCDKAKALAKEAIMSVRGSLWEWSVATPDMGTRVEIIRELMN